MTLSGHCDSPTPFLSLTVVFLKYNHTYFECSYRGDDPSWVVPEHYRAARSLKAGDWSVPIKSRLVSAVQVLSLVSFVSLHSSKDVLMP